MATRATKSTTTKKQPKKKTSSRAKKPVEKKEPIPPAAPEQLTLTPDALVEIRTYYETYLEDEMGKLHNQFVAFISESRVPLPRVLIVLEILKAETIEIARQKYMGG